MWREPHQAADARRRNAEQARRVAPILAKRRYHHLRMTLDGERVYDIDEARALVPRLRSMLLQLAVEKGRLDAAHAALHAHLRGNGDPGHAEDTARHERAVSDIRAGMSALLHHFDELGVVLRDVEMGLCDIPAERDGERVWLCWRLSDPDVAWWHSTSEGFTSRRPW